MGQNAMLVFGQQGSQIASLFGPGGAMIGAVMAVGAALLTSLAPALFGATEGLKEVRAETDTLIDRYDELTGASKEYAEILAKEKIQGYKDDIEKLNKSIEAGRRFTLSGFLATKEYTEEQEEFARRSTEAETAIEGLREKIRETELAVDGISTSFEKQSDALDRRTKQLKMSQEQIDIEKIKQLELKDTEEQLLITKVKTFHQTKRQIEANKQFADGLKAQITEEQNQEAQRKSKFESLMATLDMEIAKTQETEFANLSARIAVANLTDDERKLIQAKMDKLAALDQEKAALGAFAGWEKKTAKEKTKVMISESEKTLGAFAKNSKKAAALQKTIQIAQAVMNTYTGATAALKLPFPENIAVAAMTIAKGMAMVATIKSQSFDGGGYTGNGSRSGGVDGKGGFYAILHPKETVIDHTKPQKDLNDKINKTNQMPDMAKKLPSFEGGGYTGGVMPNNSVTNNIDNSTNTSRNFSSSFEKINNDNRNLARSFESTRNDNRNLSSSFEKINNDNRNLSSSFEKINNDNRNLSSSFEKINNDNRNFSRSDAITNNDNRSTQNIENNEQQVIVNQTINVTTGVQSTVRAEIANLMPQISEAAQNAVLEARMRGGQYSKQLVGR